MIGGGVTGASATYWLARAGFRVTCVERTFPAAGASGASFSVDISSRKTPKPFFDLSVAAARAHLELEHDLGATPWRHPTVTLEWGGSSRERSVVRERVQRLRGWGYPHRTRRPHDRPATGARAAVPRRARRPHRPLPTQAWYDTVVLTQLLLWHARHHGAYVLVGETVDRIDASDGHIHGATTAGVRRLALPQT